MYEVAMQKNTWSLGATTIMTQILTANGGFLIKAQKYGILSSLFSAAYKNGDQYYDGGPPCPIDDNQCMQRWIRYIDMTS